MDVQSTARPGPPRRVQVSYLRWGAVLAGTIVGLSIFLLMALLGLAVGLGGPEAEGTAGDARPVSPISGLWTVVSLLLAVWLAANVAGRLSGLARRTDGVLHGLVVWAAITVSLSWLAATPVGDLLGGAIVGMGNDLASLAAAAGRGEPLVGELATLSATFWWLFGGLLLSLGLALWGGAAGVRATAERATGDHRHQRRF